MLIHGLSSWSATWTRIAPGLVEHGYRVLAPDLRGHGRSPRGEYSLEGWVEDLLDSVPPEPALAIGHSLGGVILLAAVEGLRPAFAVYEDPGWFIGPEREEAIAEFEGRKRLTAEQVARANPRWPAAVVQQRIEGFELWDEAAARAFIADHADCTPTGPPVVPSLVLLAEDSPFVPAERAAGLRAAGWRVETIAGTGHHVHLDAEGAFLAAVVAATPPAAGIPRGKGP